MFSYVVDFTHQFFPLQTFSMVIEIVLEFLPKKMRSKTPATCKVVGMWLCFFATVGFLCCRLQLSVIFMWYCNEWAMMTTIFESYCKGANNDIIFQTSQDARSCEGKITTQQSNIMCCWAQEVMTTSINLMLYCKRSNDNYVFDVVHAMTISQSSWDARTQQSNIIKFCLSQWWQQWVYFFTFYCKEQWQRSYFFCVARSKVKDVWLQQGNVILRQATTNQILMLRCRSEQRLQNDNIVDAMIEFLRPALYPKKLRQQQYFFLLYHREQQPRLIMTSMQDCTSNNQPFWSMWINHINDCKSVKRQQ